MIDLINAQSPAVRITSAGSPLKASSSGTRLQNIQISHLVNVGRSSTAPNKTATAPSLRRGKIRLRAKTIFEITSSVFTIAVSNRPRCLYRTIPSRASSVNSVLARLETNQRILLLAMNCTLLLARRSEDAWKMLLSFHVRKDLHMKSGVATCNRSKSSARRWQT